jgi:hypothetical protein
MVRYRFKRRGNSGALLVYSVVVLVLLQLARSGDFSGVLTIAVTQFGGLLILYGGALGCKALYDLRAVNHEHNMKARMT